MVDKKDVVDLDKELLDQMAQDFLDESREHLDHLNLDLVRLEENPEDDELINEIFRTVHTLKGGASFVGMDGIKVISHKMEEVFGAIRSGSLKIVPSIIDTMLEAMEALNILRDRAVAKDTARFDTTRVEQELMGILSEIPLKFDASPVAEGASTSVSEIAAPKDSGVEKTRTESILPHTVMGSQTIRVVTEKLDVLINLIGEMITARNRLKEFSDRFRNDELAGIASTIERLTGQLHDAVMSVRMVPIERLFIKFPGVVRNLARQQNKQIDLIIEGEETELDKTVLEQMYDPLVHLLRNAVDHGIESPEIREKLGKPPAGRIGLLSRYEKGGVLIEVADDGGGIDPEIIREVAVRKGIISSEEARLMSDDHAIRFMFTPGFSTSLQVSELSGRGVGMDVVRENVQRLRGVMDVETAVGKGTVIRIQLPLTLAILDVLLVKVAGFTYALQLNIVSETMLIAASEISSIEKNEVIFVRGKALPLKRLGALLKCASTGMTGKGPIPVVIVGLAEKKVALAVDELLGKQEVVMKSIGNYLGRVEGIEGASVLADGTVTLIVDIDATLRMNENAS
jgi:two-component system, chemotaxis family, sensor kinase CheA